MRRHTDTGTGTGIGTGTGRAVDELSGGFEATASSLNTRRVLVGDGLERQVDEFIAAGKALYETAMYALMEREREGTSPVQ
jgi:hypothetical protein